MPSALTRVLDKMRDPAWLDRPQQQPQEIGNEAPVGLMPEDQPLPSHALQGFGATPSMGGPGEEGGVPTPEGGGLLQKKLRMMQLMKNSPTQQGLNPMQTLAGGDYGG
jgi:hypothetical protein